ncbi:MAG: ABC transporter ATP-binding protein, partial [Thermomicrobiales bacterium]
LARKPGGLSSGQKQRVSLARAIVRTPSVLLLDEPLSHLDAAERDATRRELKRLQRETGFTTVLVTHDQHEALSLADRIAVMHDGEFQQVGTADEVYDRPANLFVAEFVGEPRMNLLPGRLRVAGGSELEAILGESAPVALGRAHRPDLDGREIVLGIRPQDIRVTPAGTTGTIAARVFAFEPLQEIGRLTLDLLGATQRIVVETHHDLHAAPGDAIGLRFDLARTHLFDTTTGERLDWRTEAHTG